jgi:hypothetical protein
VYSLLFPHLSLSFSFSLSLSFSGPIFLFLADFAARGWAIRDPGRSRSSPSAVDWSTTCRIKPLSAVHAGWSRKCGDGERSAHHNPISKALEVGHPSET